MPDEQISYLEPIEENVNAESTLNQSVSGKASEQMPKPEASPEKQSEAMSAHNELYQNILKTVPVAAPVSSASVSDDAATVALGIDAASKVTQLVELASTKGVVHAVKVAKHLQDFYVLDALHDDLANQFYTSLKEKGLIEE